MSVSIYDQEAQYWASKLDRLGVPNAYADVLLVTLGQTRYPKADKPLAVLDCGFGARDIALALATVIEPRLLQLDALDLSPQKLIEAEQRLSRMGVTPRLHQADVQTLPFVDESFDLVVCARVLEHLAEPGRTLAEMRRVLRPGGQLVMCGTRRSLLGSLITRRWRTHSVTPTEAKRWLSQRGFEQVRQVTSAGHALFNRLSVVCTARKSARRTASQRRQVAA